MAITLLAVLQDDKVSTPVQRDVFYLLAENGKTVKQRGKLLKSQRVGGFYHKHVL